jgi:drug/metabolite transporter (DMT)-like permease
MNALKIVAILLIVAGALGATYGGFSYTKETHAASIGPLQLQMVEKERVNIPMWAGLAAIGAGVMLLLAASRKG